jgi:hypothetical protein
MENKIKVNNFVNDTQFIFYEFVKWNKGDVIIARILGRRTIKSGDYSFDVVDGIDLIRNKRITFTNTVIVRNFYMISERVVRFICHEVEQKEIEGEMRSIPRLSIESVELVFNEEMNAFEIR